MPDKTYTEIYVFPENTLNKPQRDLCLFWLLAWSEGLLYIWKLNWNIRNLSELRLFSARQDLGLRLIKECQSEATVNLKEIVCLLWGLTGLTGLP